MSAQIEKYLSSIFPDEEEKENALFLLKHMSATVQEGNIKDLPVYTAAQVIFNYLKYLTTKYSIEELLGMNTISTYWKESYMNDSYVGTCIIGASMKQPCRIPDYYNHLSISKILRLGKKDKLIYSAVEPLYSLDYYTLKTLQRHNDDNNEDNLTTLIKRLFMYYDYLLCRTGLKDSSFTEQESL